MTHSPKESLKQSLIEMKLIRQGKMKGKTWEEYRNESFLQTAKRLPVVDGKITLNRDNSNHIEWGEGYEELDMSKYPSD